MVYHLLTGTSQKYQPQLYKLYLSLFAYLFVYFIPLLVFLSLLWLSLNTNYDDDDDNDNITPVNLYMASKR